MCIACGNQSDDIICSDCIALAKEAWEGLTDEQRAIYNGAFYLAERDA